MLTSLRLQSDLRVVYRFYHRVTEWNAGATKCAGALQRGLVHYSVGWGIKELNGVNCRVG